MQQVNLGDKTFKGRVLNSPFFGKIAVCFIALLMTVSAQAQNLTAKVYQQKGTSDYYYGKLHIPKGGKYHIARYPGEDITVAVFRAHIDGENIYLGTLDTYNGEYWIDASEVEQNFLIRNNDGKDVVAIPVTAEDEALMEKKHWYFYDKTDARRNSFKYTTVTIDNETLRNNDPFAGCPIYVFANPTKFGLIFAWLNQYSTTNSLPANSLYVLGEEGSRGRLMNIIFEDEPDMAVDEATAIQSVSRGTVGEDNGTVYTLQGVRVTQLKKGSLYIRNGKKFIAR
jgi:hypothetical protein